MHKERIEAQLAAAHAEGSKFAGTLLAKVRSGASPTQIWNLYLSSVGHKGEPTRSSAAKADDRRTLGIPENDLD